MDSHTIKFPLLITALNVILYVKIVVILKLPILKWPSELGINIYWKNGLIILLDFY